jgi:hypothetical protein
MKDFDAPQSNSAVSPITDDGMGQYQSSSSTIGQIVTAVLMRVYGPGMTVIDDAAFDKIPAAVDAEIKSGRYIDVTNNLQGAADLADDVCVEVRKWLLELALSAGRIPKRSRGRPELFVNGLKRCLGGDCFQGY